ncbi:hypothetical protein PYCC9005_005944 [Savitreella phatthalungensis]
MAYVVTASKPSSVRLSCAGHFISASRQTLATASSSLIHFYADDTLDPVHELEIYGRVTTLTTIRAPGEKLDSLFVTTEDHRYFTLSYVDGAFETGVSGSMETPGMLSPETGHRVTTDDDMVVVFFYCGLITVLPFYNSAKRSKKRARDAGRTFGPACAIRVLEVKAHDIMLIDGVLTILYRDHQLLTHAKTYNVIYKRGEFDLEPHGSELRQLEAGTSMLLSLGAPGEFAAIGETEFGVMSAEKGFLRIPLETPTLFNSRTSAGWRKYILGDDYGLLWQFDFNASPPSVVRLEPPVDQTPLSIPATLRVFNDKYLFLGSHYADSQLLDLATLDLIASKTNLGPIQDMVLRSDSGSAGLNTLLTASGAYRDGCIRIVRYGVGMTDQAEIAIDNVRGIYGVTDLSVVVVAVVGGFIVLQVSADGHIEQLTAGEQDVVGAFSHAGKLFLVYKDAVVSYDGASELASLSLPGISAAKQYGEHVLLSQGSQLSLFKIIGKSLEKVASISLESEISSIELTEDTVIAGHWSSPALWVGNLKLQKSAEIPLGDGLVPHAILLRHLSTMDSPTLFVGATDGTLVTFAFDSSARAVSTRKQVTLGTISLSLHELQTPQGLNVFIISDRPTLAFAARGKISLSSVNIAGCAFFTSFECAALNSTMVVATDTGLRIGGIDSTQKLQYRAVPVGELVRRLVAFGEVYAALTMRLEVEQVTGNETQRSFVRIFDRETFELLETLELDNNEMCQSICVLDSRLLAVGTSITEEGVDECRSGRILLLAYDELTKTLSMTAQHETPGSVYCVADTRGQLVAGVNAYVYLYNVRESNGAVEVVQLSKQRSGTYAITMRASGSRVVYGDLMKSVVLSDVVASELRELARDYIPMWTTAVDFFGDAQGGGMIASEADGNLVLINLSESPLEELRERLDRTGSLHYGEMVNVFCAGAIVEPEDSGTRASGTASTHLVQPLSLFGTVDGTIGIVGRIASDQVNLLLELQSAMASVIQPVGGLNFFDWRGYRTPHVKVAEPSRFVDGDLIEKFLDFSADRKKSVADQVGQSVDHLETMVEELSRLH